MSSAALQMQRRPLLDAMVAPGGDAYDVHMVRFAEFVGDGEVTLPAVADYFRSLAGSSYAANTIRVMRCAVKARLRRAMAGMDFNQRAAFQQAMASLDEQVRPPVVQKAPVSSSRVLKRSEYQRLLEVASVRDALWIRTLWVTGARVSELTGARLDRCREAGGVVYLTVLGKRSKERTLRLRAALYQAIRDEFHGQEFLFETASGKPFRRGYVSSRIHALSMKVLGRPLTAHCLRHSFGTRQVLAGKPLKAISTYMGHSSTAITNDYYVSAELSDDDLFGDD